MTLLSSYPARFTPFSAVPSKLATRFGGASCVGIARIKDTWPVKFSADAVKHPESNKRNAGWVSGTVYFMLLFRRKQYQYSQSTIVWRSSRTVDKTKPTAEILLHMCRPLRQTLDYIGNAIPLYKEHGQTSSPSVRRNLMMLVHTRSGMLWRSWNVK